MGERGRKLGCRALDPGSVCSHACACAVWRCRAMAPERSMCGGRCRAMAPERMFIILELLQGDCPGALVLPRKGRQQRTSSVPAGCLCLLVTPQPERCIVDTVVCPV